MQVSNKGGGIRLLRLAGNVNAPTGQGEGEWWVSGARLEGEGVGSEGSVAGAPARLVHSGAAGVATHCSQVQQPMSLMWRLAARSGGGGGAAKGV